jgi:hypothetical protein
MRSLKIILLCLTVTGPVAAQHFHPPYENDWLGWRKVINFKGATKPLTVDEKTYSIAKISLADSFANWMYASYYPKGCLGDVTRYVTPKKNVYFERYNQAVPPSVGARVNSYIFLKNQGGKWEPENNLGYGWTIAANEIPLASRVMDYCTEKVCVFTIIRHNEKLIREQPNSDAARDKALYDISREPNISKYIFFDMPSRNNSELKQSWVILSKNNRFPFIPVTIGEAIRFIEEAMPVKYEEERKVAVDQNSYDAAQLKQAMNNLDTKYQKARATLARVKEKYRDRLQNPAYATYGQYVITDLANGADMFTARQVDEHADMDETTPLYRVDPELEKGCQSDQPQWIVVKWFGGNLDEPAFQHMHKQILRNLNFDYIYQFFFDPSKVKGQPYRPLHAPREEELQAVQESSDASKEISSRPGVSFYDDFSTTPTGSTPANWKSEINVLGAKAKVVTPDGAEGQWLEIRGHYFVYPLALKKPLPANMVLSFDLAVPKDIPWGSKALELFLCTANTLDERKPLLKLRFRAGFSGRPGVMAVEGFFGDAYLKGVPAEIEARGFSNDKTFNHVKVRVVRKGEQLEVFFNEQLAIRVPKAMPVETLFQFMQFKHLNVGAEQERYYISNLMIEAN